MLEPLCKASKIGRRKLLDFFFNLRRSHEGQDSVLREMLQIFNGPTPSSAAPSAG
jgi:hypothetical protein